MGVYSDKHHNRETVVAKSLFPSQRFFRSDGSPDGEFAPRQPSNETEEGLSPNNIEEGEHGEKTNILTYKNIVKT